MMTSSEYIEQHTHKIYECDDEPLYVTEDDAYEAVTIALKNICWDIHGRISRGDSLSEIDRYVTDICDF